MDNEQESSGLIDIESEACAGDEVVEVSSDKEYQQFKSIDRSQENNLVGLYRKNKDVSVLSKLLELRDQTLRYMAKKYAYLDNEDDMYSEFKRVWLKCVRKYDNNPKPRPVRDKSGKVVMNEDGTMMMVSKKTPFNTYLYTSMKNRVWNIIKHRHSKRLSDDEGRPVVETMRSLDYEYGEDGDMTMMDVIPDIKARSSLAAAEMSEILAHLGTSDPDIARTVDTFLSNTRMESLTAACNYRAGRLKINKWDRIVLSMGVTTEDSEPSDEMRKKSLFYLGKMIDFTKNFQGEYEIESYILEAGSVHFVVKMEDAKVLKKVKDAIARCRIELAV